MVYDIRVRPLCNEWLIEVCIWHDRKTDQLQLIDGAIAETDAELKTYYDDYFYKYIISK